MLTVTRRIAYDYSKGVVVIMMDVTSPPNTTLEYELSELIEDGKAEYLGVFEHDDKICDYYLVNHTNAVSFLYVERVEE